MISSHQLIPSPVHHMSSLRVFVGENPMKSWRASSKGAQSVRIMTLWGLSTNHLNFQTRLRIKHQASSPRSQPSVKIWCFNHCTNLVSCQHQKERISRQDGAIGTNNQVISDINQIHNTILGEEPISLFWIIMLPDLLWLIKKGRKLVKYNVERKPFPKSSKNKDQRIVRWYA